MKSPQELLQTFTHKLSLISSLPSLQELETEYLGRQGVINDALKNIKDIEVTQRKSFGQDVNAVKQQIQSALEAKKHEIIRIEESTQKIDTTLPGTQYPQGSLHMVTYAIEEISRIFEKIGFIRMSYPEIEWEFFSFEALNMPSDHPARDDFETFFMDHTPHKEYGKMVMTPHTSSGQHREMKRLGKPPIRMINIAKTYRPNWDASHVPMFHQFEGLCVDKRINITHLKGTIDYFAKSFFGEERETRLRPFHFQFTEPSFEVDITCDICGGTGYITDDNSSTSTLVNSLTQTPANPHTRKHDNTKSKCKLCKQGWLELGGTGMVHPNVLKAGGIDPDEYTGWAFGFGVERVMMMRPGTGLSNMRLLYDGDIRVLEQF